MDFTTSEQNKDFLIKNVLKLLRTQNKLPNISENYSSEGGFNLPWDEESISREFNNKQLALIYHDSRQLRFKSDGNIITGLRFKDECNYWSYEEIQILKDAINEVLRKIQN